MSQRKPGLVWMAQPWQSIDVTVVAVGALQQPWFGSTIVVVHCLAAEVAETAVAVARVAKRIDASMMLMSDNIFCEECMFGI